MSAGNHKKVFIGECGLGGRMVGLLTFGEIVNRRMAKAAQNLPKSFNENIL
jgi:hypothetical protein